MTTFRLSYDRAVKRGTENDPNPEVLPAKHGPFSDPFFKQTRRALEIAPELVEHMLTKTLTLGASSFEERVDSSHEHDMLKGGFDDANYLYKALTYWSLVFSKHVQVPPPTPARHAWRSPDGKVIGLPSGISPSAAGMVTAITTTWLRTQLEGIMRANPADVMEFFETAKEVFRLGAKHPMRDRDRWSALKCPSCGGVMAIWVPPAPPQGTRDERGRLVPHGGERRFTCDVCQTSMTDAEYQAEVDAQVTSTKERQKIMLQWGRQIPGEWRL